jgi:1,4-dihydroxy-2-naphthoate octaprenyltransferase
VAKVSRTVLQSRDGPTLNLALATTAKLHLFSGLLAAMGLVLQGLLSRPG